MTEHDHGEGPSSPPCLMHKFASELLPPAKDGWAAVRSFRKATRADLLARRGTLSFHDRQRYAESLTAHLLAALDLRAYRVLGFYWQWQPGAALQRGFWNIPVPAERRRVVPDALLIPLVGYDAAGYRLGYGGGYYDRTLAELALRPLCIGVGYDEAELATSQPQPHDVPMDLMVTERRVLRFAR